jgi:hypothetical protein
VRLVPVVARAGVDLKCNAKICRFAHQANDLAGYFIDGLFLDFKNQLVVHLHDHAGRLYASSRVAIVLAPAAAAAVRAALAR